MYTDEEVAMHYLEFYEDVHTEFLKFGELVNFKVCRNASSHLRGNVYVHYQSLDSALAARRALNGRFYAGKQITCEFVGVTKWRLAICGEYLRSYYKTCSRGNVCNFLHCFPNPGGEYGWADRDKPPPRSWLEKMDVLFGCSRASHHDDLTPRENVWSHRTRYKVSSRKEKAYGKYSRSNDRNNHQQNSASSSSKSYSEDEKEQELDTNKSIVCSSGTKGREHNVHDKDKIKNDNEVIPRNDKKGDQRKRHRSSKTSDRSSHGSKRRHHQEHTLADQDLEFGSINTSDTDDEPIQDKVKKNDRHESSLQSSQSKKEEKRPARRRSPEFDNIDDHDKTRSSLRRDQQYDKLSKSETSNRRDGSSKRSREYMRRERNRSRSPRIRDERSRSPKREHSRRKRVKQSRHSHRDLQKSPEENSIDSLNRWQPSEDSR